MKRLLILIVAVLYLLALFYLLIGPFSIGVRVGGNIFVEEGFGFLSVTRLLLFIVLAGGGLYPLWRIARRSS